MAYTKIAVAGASGNLGTPMLEALLAANYTVTVLTRQSSTHTFPAGVHKASVDYTSEASLKAALEGQDALVSTLSTGAIDAQASLMSAAIAAGVQRIIPSEFGCDTKAPANRKLAVFGQKLAVQKQLEEQTKGTNTTYTYVVNNIFTDWGMKNGFIVDVKRKKIELHDGGEVEYSTTPLSSIAKAVVGVLKHPQETENRLVRIHGAVLTQKKVLELAQKVVGNDGWTITEPSTAETEKKSWEVLHNDPSNFMGWVIGFLKRANFAKEHEPKFIENYNELLGVPQLTDAEIEAFIKQAAAA